MIGITFGISKPPPLPLLPFSSPGFPPFPILPSKKKKSAADLAPSLKVTTPQEARFIWQPSRDTGGQKTETVKHSRRPDAVLVPASDRNIPQFEWGRILVCVEYTITAVPPLRPPSTKNESKGIGIPQKTGQLLWKIVDVLAEQPTRQFAWGLAFSGPKDRTNLDIVLMDHERIHSVRIPNCWAEENIGRVAALLATLATASLSQLGLSPVVNYSEEIVPHSIDLRDLSTNFGICEGAFFFVARFRS